MTKRTRDEMTPAAANLLTADAPEQLLQLLTSITDTKIVSKLEQLNHSADGTVEPFLCTHHGGFHCDEALALAMLKMLPEYEKLPIVRTRDPEIIKKAQLVVDVGGVYSHDLNKYDHHMGDFTTTFSPKHKVTKLSSAGLVYLHFARKLMALFIEKSHDKDSSGEKPEITDILINKLYRNFIEEVDAIDNGVEMSEHMKYRIGTGLGSRIKRLNPSWRQENVSSETENYQFKKAMMVCGEEWFYQVQSLLVEWYPARKIVADACASACPEYYTSSHPAGTQNGHLKLDADSRTLILPRCCPWQEHLLDIEHELNIASDKDKQILYCIFPDSRSGSFRIQAVPKIRGSFENRKPLPKPWRGVRDDELSGVAGIPGCVFTHASGFIGGNQTLEGAKEMARKAVEFPMEQNL
ncbi:unnamed protein product [Amoebophrya sp. A120]|nr:unnamed protein product [Amoebophrya sp. A120]|eukprot:GSA120T00009678001.1